VSAAGSEASPITVRIAGGGVAALEALLTLRSALGDRARVELIAPDPEFVFRPLLVAEPFGLTRALRIELERVAQENGASYRWDAVISVDPTRRRIATAGGDELDYDALLLAIGTRPVEAVPGALTFGGAEQRAAFAELLGRLGAGGPSRLVFAAPAEVKWTIAAYELALLTAAHLSDRDVSGVETLVVTHEDEPLGLFGPSGPRIVNDLLEEQGVRLLTSSAPIRFEAGLLEVADGEPVAADRVVALPGLEVPPIAGIPQRHRGFIPTDVRMSVEGLARVWAAGDATWFPIKQGGLAAQQAAVAAGAIARMAGGTPSDVAYRPTLRAALLTGALPRYLRSEMWDAPKSSESSAVSLWWPPGKIAGRHLSSYLARVARGEAVPSSTLSDVDALPEAETAAAEAENLEAVHFGLEAAEADARGGDYAGALEWLETVEELALVLPSPYAERRADWTRRARRRVAGAGEMLR